MANDIKEELPKHLGACPHEQTRQCYGQEVRIWVQQITHLILKLRNLEVGLALLITPESETVSSAIGFQKISSDTM